MSQSEQQLEQNLIDRLTRLSYEPIKISNAAELIANLKTQLEKHNHTQLSPEEINNSAASYGVLEIAGSDSLPFMVSGRIGSI